MSLLTCEGIISQPRLRRKRLVWSPSALDTPQNGGQNRKRLMMSTRTFKNYVCLEFSDKCRTGKSGKAVKIHQLDLEGNFIKPHDSIKLANESLGLASDHKGINAHMHPTNGKYVNGFKGFMWKRVA
jgi:hypothetical protein